MLELNQTYPTREGGSAKIVATNLSDNEYPILAVIIRPDGEIVKHSRTSYKVQVKHPTFDFTNWVDPKYIDGIPYPAHIFREIDQYFDDIHRLMCEKFPIWSVVRWFSSIFIVTKHKRGALVLDNRQVNTYRLFQDYEAGYFRCTSLLST